MNYQTAVGQTWRHWTQHAATRRELVSELVRYATLAPSSHNTQCWRFRCSENGVSILPDFTRRCPVVDPDDHHLFVSLGCAAENLVQAAAASGLSATVGHQPDGALRIDLDGGSEKAGPLFNAIPERQCTRTDYDGRPVGVDELKLLETAGSGNGVRVVLLTERRAIETVLDYVMQANSAQLTNPEFRRELKSWVRFSESEALAKGDGLFGKSSGNPAVPRWLGSLIFGMVLRAGAENDRYARQVRSSAGIALFASDTDDIAHWIEAGRCYQRFALQATALGVRNAFVNQPVEERRLRPGFAAEFGLGSSRPDLVVRFGRGPLMPRSLRRPLQSVIEWPA